MTIEEFLDELKNLPPEFILKNNTGWPLIRFDALNKNAYNLCPICAVCLEKSGKLYGNWSVDLAARELNLKNHDIIISASDGLTSEVSEKIRRIIRNRTI